MLQPIKDLLATPEGQFIINMDEDDGISARTFTGQWKEKASRGKKKKESQVPVNNPLDVTVTNPM